MESTLNAVCLRLLGLDYIFRQDLKCSYKGNYSEVRPIVPTLKPTAGLAV